MYIYKTTNLITDKIYIGQHTLNDSKYLGSGVYLKHAIKKYSKKNFTKEILETCNSVEQLNEREVYWISKLNSRDPKIGYNIDFGGSQRETCPEEVKEKISNSLKGNVPWNKGLTRETDIRVKHIAENKRGKTNSRKGIKVGPMSKERKLKLKGRNCFKRQVIAINITTNEQISFSSVKEASKALNIQRSGISFCLHGKQKTAGGYFWK
jgi:group I intron endonuclease